MRASRQTELQREFPLHVVCSWLGNSPRIAQQSYLLVTEDGVSRTVAGRMQSGQFIGRPFCYFINVVRQAIHYVLIFRLAR
jgi:hypothetical protein